MWPVQEKLWPAQVLSSPAGSGIEKPIGEAVLQIDTMVAKERKVNVRGEAPFRD